jgi:hypothetical protein
MKLDVLLKKIKKLTLEWGIFYAFAIILNGLVFSGIIYRKANIDPELETYVDYFQDVALLYNVRIELKNITIEFADQYPVKGWVGLCDTSSATISKVTFLRSYFNKISLEQRYALVLHELGHCVLKKGHDATMIDKCPTSIMHPSDGLGGCYFKNQDYYLTELFKR